ncbi:putative leucine-rich repeat receptor-like protein kinase [Iris pallida]|uniref:Leucine-rich repeat receptor-like protein kinase n=1 Tax=Iris pallida TaxID=29817 RepID=A0AAX6FET9_IRIPA|nr:putative leucine-rich repeat receptor-like protein kinase [Iris pallida]
MLKAKLSVMWADFKSSYHRFLQPVSLTVMIVYLPLYLAIYVGNLNFSFQQLHSLTGTVPTFEHPEQFVNIIR